MSILIYDDTRNDYYAQEDIYTALLKVINKKQSNKKSSSNKYPKQTSDPYPTQRYVDNSLYNKSDKYFDVDAAARCLNANALPKSEKVCATYVRFAIEAGFHDPKSTKGHPENAWEYMKFLPGIGFKYVDTVDRGMNGTKGEYIPQKGDIAVYQKNRNPNLPGHICMFDGRQWISDFFQRSMFVYPSSNVSHANIYRYENE